MAERITYTTNDGVQIVGDWLAAPTTTGAVILLHMMPANRKAWADFQPALAKRGIASLAIDMRGHGDSTVGPEKATIDFKKFSDEEHQSALLDVIGAFEWLQRRGFERPRIALAGASFGANLALQFLGEEPLVSGAALFSPGRNYKGTNAVSDAGAILPHQSLWIAASEGDDQESFECAKEVLEEAPCDRKIFIPLKNAGHGNAILGNQPQLVDRLADWLKETIQGV